MVSGMHSNHQLTTREVGDIVDLINKMLNKKQYEQFDEVLRTMKISDTCVQELVAYARCSFMARNKLKYWKTFVGECSSELSDRGLQGHNILRGLL